VILFREENVEPIIDGRKTQTRRFWSRWRVKVGGEYLIYTRPPWGKEPGRPVARIRVTKRWKEKLGDITHPNARAEGFLNVAEFLAAFVRINHLNDTAGLFLNEEVHAVEFRCLEDLRRAA
jgi:hypothetical protein